MKRLDITETVITVLVAAAVLIAFVVVGAVVLEVFW